MARPITEEEVNAFMRQFKLLIVGIAVLFGLPLLVYVCCLDRRLDAFEDSLQYCPPQEVDAFFSEDASDALAANPVQGQVVYVPAYSHIYHDDGARSLLTAANKFKRIYLVCTGRRGDHGAFERALRICLRCGSELYIVSVVASPPPTRWRLLSSWNAAPENLAGAVEQSAERQRIMTRAAG